VTRLNSTSKLGAASPKIVTAYDPEPANEGCNNWPRRNKLASSRLARMPKYLFHLAGQFPARDLLGHECANDKEATQVSSRIGLARKNPKWSAKATTS
jgi:hypothetical protein